MNSAEHLKKSEVNKTTGKKNHSLMSVLSQFDKCEAFWKVEGGHLEFASSLY